MLTMAVPLVLSIVIIFCRALHLPYFDDKIGARNTHSMSHRCQSDQAWYLHYFDDKNECIIATECSRKIIRANKNSARSGLPLHNIYTLALALHIVSLAGKLLKVVVVFEILKHNAIRLDALKVAVALTLKLVDMVL